MGRSNFIPTHAAITLPDSTTVAVPLARYSREHLFRIDPAGPVAYRWSSDQAAVDAGGGFPMNSSETISFDQDILGTTVYFRQVSGGPATLHHAFMRPAGGVS